MSLLSLANLVALVTYVYLTILVIIRNPKSRLNWFCALILLAFAVWALEDFVHGNPATTPGRARFFSNIGVFGWSSFASSFFIFVLIFTRHTLTRQRRMIYPLLFAPAPLFIYLQWSGHLLANQVLYSFGWVTYWSKSVWPLLYFAWYGGLMLASLYLIRRFRNRSARAFERRQADEIFAVTLISLVLATFTDVVLNRFVRSGTPQLASLVGMVWAAGLYRSVTRYGLMSFTPEAAAQGILATMADALFLLTIEGNVVTANEAAIALTGYPPGELKDCPAGSLFARPEEFQAALDEVIRDGSCRRIEIACRARDGHEIPVSITAQLMRDREHEALGVVWVLRDITERKRAEAQLMQHERLATIGKVASGMAHELRNPLGIISNAIYVLNTAQIQELSEKSLRYLQMIGEQVERADRLIAALADFARTRPPHPQPTPIPEIVDKVLAEQQIPSGVRITKVMPFDAPLALVDPEQTHVVVAHVVRNAIQAMPDGGVLTIEVQESQDRGTRRIEDLAGSRTSQDRGPRRIEDLAGSAPSASAAILRAQRSRESDDTASAAILQVRISDTGGGIAPEYTNRIFEPLFSTKTYGIGFGLAIARNFVEQNGGTISFASKPGEGTTFTVSLPVAGTRAA